MKLISEVSTHTDYIDSVAVGYGQVTRIMGRTSVNDVKILVEDKPRNDAEEMWHILKYGQVSDLELNTKYDKLVFQEGDIELTLYGVIPYEHERSSIWNGRVFTCTVDNFERK